MTVHTVPVIDLTPGPAATADLVGQACADVGYFQITGHGIPRPLLAELFAVTRRFFALPPEVKQQVAQPAADQVRGWSGAGSEGITYSLDEESPADLKEKFDIGTVDPRPGPPTGPHHAPNLWPAGLPRFRETWEAAHREFSRVDTAVQRCAGLALGLGPDALTAHFTQPVSMLRALYYPDQPEPPLPGQLRAGVHSDYGAFTLAVAEDRPGALQVLDRGGEWTDVPVIPGAVLVMLGDLLTEWTDDRWPATLHRVVNPRRDQAMDADRLAFAFYSHPDPEASLHVLPGLPGGDQPPPPGTPTAGEHLRDKYVRQTSFGPHR
ncbi:2-oxoglutarate and iron-dependent oxygenase domain-containing protein [Klenkia sp. LSe6-5]|uniref:2-oxoglutarate and iron-dependent oxygenase domain-containing protein n=1 Tax=Klenkia sesuvii TaxID=3103137 RepID=A0ABU8DR73_9ACTN